MNRVIKEQFQIAHDLKQALLDEEKNKIHINGSFGTGKTYSLKEICFNEKINYYNEGSEYIYYKKNEKFKDYQNSEIIKMKIINDITYYYFCSSKEYHEKFYKMQ